MQITTLSRKYHNLYHEKKQCTHFL